MINDTAALHQRKVLRVGLIVDGPRAPHYVQALAAWAATQDSIDFSHLIIQDVPRASAARTKLGRAWASLYHGGVVDFLTKLLWSLIVRAEKFKLGRGDYAQHFVQKDLSTLVRGSIRVSPKISKSGLVYRYGASDIAAIKAQQFDVLLRCGKGILRGDILSAARFGVLSFHHADNRINRGIPPGFWEVLQQLPSTGFIIQQLTDELDGGNVLFRGGFPTQRYWFTNQAELYTRSNYYLQQLLLSIAANDALPKVEESVPYYNPLFKAPNLQSLLRYGLQLMMYKVQHLAAHRLRGQKQRWGVAFARKNWKQLVMWKAKRIENPPGRFLADPFVITRDGRDYCFVEDYEYASDRGRISVYELRDDGAVFVGIALEEPFHLSFPYLFEHQGKIYLLPETAKAKDIRLYECICFPLQWKFATVVMSNVSAVDSMIFYYAPYWWLLSNINPLGRGDHCSELSAFYATDPIQGPWIAHSANPLIIDPTRARNGGLLFDSEFIYRVSQRYGFMQYGKGATIHRIEMLTPETYREREFSRIEPNFFEGLIGTHHLHSNGTVTVFDFVEKAKIT